MTDTRTPTPLFSGEVQLRRWSESSTQGVQVTFTLADASDLEPLKAKAGKRFMAVLVEIGDDEMPVEPPKARFTPGPLCSEAIVLARDPEFQRWVSECCGGPTSESEARGFMLGLCGIESRKDLDTVATAAEKFRALVRGAFHRWQRSRRTA